MPWLALPYEQQAVGSRLSSRFGVAGIPRLVIVGADGEVSRCSHHLASQGRGASRLCAAAGVQRLLAGRLPALTSFHALPPAPCPPPCTWERRWWPATRGLQCWPTARAPHSHGLALQAPRSCRGACRGSWPAACLPACLTLLCCCTRRASLPCSCQRHHSTFTQAAVAARPAPTVCAVLLVQPMDAEGVSVTTARHQCCSLQPTWEAVLASMGGVTRMAPGKPPTALPTAPPTLEMGPRTVQLPSACSTAADSRVMLARYCCLLHATALAPALVASWSYCVEQLQCVERERAESSRASGGRGAQPQRCIWRSASRWCGPWISIAWFSAIILLEAKLKTVVRSWGLSSLADRAASRQRACAGGCAGSTWQAAAAADASSSSQYGVRCSKRHADACKARDEKQQQRSGDSAGSRRGPMFSAP